MVDISERECRKSFFVSQLFKSLQLEKKAKEIRAKSRQELLLKSKLEEYEDDTRKWVFRCVVQWLIQPAWKNRLVRMTVIFYKGNNHFFLGSLS